MPNTSPKPAVTVIIPVYNPPPQWHESCLEHIISLQALHPQYQFHFVLVNDGSPRNVFRRIHRKLELFKVSYTLCYLEHNFGKGMALRKGLSKAKRGTNLFITVDWDFPFGVLVIGSILKKLQEGCEVVFVDRGKEYLSQIPPIRSFLTRIWRHFIMRFFHLEINDSQAGVKGFSRIAVPYFLSCQINSFLHDLEFLLKCHHHHLKTTSIKAQLRGGVRLSDFSLSVYFREIKMLGYLVRSATKSHEKIDH